jgi:hypothetical protein
MSNILCIKIFKISPFDGTNSREAPVGAAEGGTPFGGPLCVKRIVVVYTEGNTVDAAVEGGRVFGAANGREAPVGMNNLVVQRRFKTISASNKI